MKNKKQLFENIVHGIFLILGLIAVACVLMIYHIPGHLRHSGHPGDRPGATSSSATSWASTAAEPNYGILPFILTSVYGTAGAIVIGVPDRLPHRRVSGQDRAPEACAAVLRSRRAACWPASPPWSTAWWACWCWCPASGKIFHMPDGASLLAAIIVLAVMILPSIIKVSVTALRGGAPGV